MISIRKTGDELDRLDNLARTIAAVYDHAIWSTAQYAVEVDAPATHAFREHLNVLRDELVRASCPEDWEVLQASFRGELRDFRDQSSRQLARFRNELADTVSAMNSFADSIAATGGDHGDDLRNALTELKQAARTDDLDLIRSLIGSATAAIGSSVERLRKSHAIAIVQLRDEIRLLQKQVETERQAAQVDPSTGVWNRQKMEASLATFIDRDECFSLLILLVSNLRRIDSQFSRAAIETAMRSLVQRLTVMLDETAVVGRWDNESFAVLLPLEPAAAIRVSREACKRLSGTYAVQDAGVAGQISLVVATGVIDHAPGSGPAAFAKRLEQMSNTLTIA